MKKIKEWVDMFLGCSLSTKNDMSTFMKEVNKMDVDPLVLDRFLHDGFDTNMKTFKMYLKIYYAKKR